MSFFTFDLISSSTKTVHWHARSHCTCAFSSEGFDFIVTNRCWGVELVEPFLFHFIRKRTRSQCVVSFDLDRRGFMTHKGIPDGSRAARLILKDYVNGKLLYCYPPPGYDPVEFQHFSKRFPQTEETESADEDEEGTAPTASAAKVDLVDRFFPLDLRFCASLGSAFSTVWCRSTVFSPCTFDTSSLITTIFDSFLFQTDVRFGSKGIHGRVNYTRKNGPVLVTDGTSAASANGLAEGKPWKKHHNRNKKEKLRRLYGHLDA